MAHPAPEFGKLLEDLRRTRLLVTPQELSHRLPAVLPTGLEPLDRLLGGGLPEGRVVELGEGGGAHASALALRMLARTTAEGRSAAWVDRTDAFDPRGAAEAGADLERTLWCRPSSEKDAIRAADVLLSSGAFALVILDLARPPAAGLPRQGGGAPALPAADRRDGPPAAGRRAPPSQAGDAEPIGRRSPPSQAEDAEPIGRRAPPSQAGDAELSAAGPSQAGEAEPLAGARRSPGLDTGLRYEPYTAAPRDEGSRAPRSPGLDAGLRYEPYAAATRRPKRKAEEAISQGAWLRLARDAESARASLVVLGSPVAAGVAAASLRVSRCRARFEGRGCGRTFEGLELVVALERNRLGLSPGEAALSFRAPSHFLPTREPAPGEARTGRRP